MKGLQYPDGSVDYLLIGMGSGKAEQRLYRWRETCPDFAPGLFTHEYHRLQLEHWLSFYRDELQGDVMDVGQPFHRHWGGPGYFTLGLGGDCDLLGDITNMPEITDASLDAVVAVEVFEHCADPFAASREIYRVLRPGGLFLVAAPFIWPDHHTDEYPDFFRYTPQGWELLLQRNAGFDIKAILALDWTVEGRQGYDQMRRYEGMGFRDWVEGATGYCVEARKPKECP